MKTETILVEATVDVPSDGGSTPPASTISMQDFEGHFKSR
ncbi:hypothetical protein MTY_1399 [Moorella thermoacetica Y72]|uniref:Uncharacterized protein n=1 Tax=Moorella thermoacetica Y72 TaxID=1325331 RepID=A0A0S6UEM8_NEOTH|nr:hypothetical protein MTY_1399 [Moorella thermoacetica Y72]